MSWHTPGPWQVHGSHIYTANPGRALLAQVFNPGSKASDYPLTANARLIAAAPELLAALRDLLDAVRQNDEGGVPPTADLIFARAGDAAIAAIAKAEGRP